MLKVLKNLKKSLGSVIAIVILLCIQAATDLALPDYTSKIVNEGIQAGGITSSAPDIISKDNMDTILLFTEQDEEILNDYTLVSTNLDKHQEKIINKYLGKDYNVENYSIYVLNELEEEEKANLEKIIAGPVIEMITITDKVSQMPEEQRNQMLNEATKQIDAMADSIKEQAAVASVKQIYQNLRIDTDKIQNDYIFISGLQMLGVALVSMISAVSIMFL